MSFKISISGKANSGKNTLSRLIAKELKSRLEKGWKGVRYLSFADPVKEMAMTMFPDLPRKFFFGPSKFRNEIIPGTSKSIRDLLIEIGTKVGRGTKEDVWLENFQHRVKKTEKKNPPSLIVCPDQRFVNEWKMLRDHDFFQVRLLREKAAKLNDVSEVEQENLKDADFDWVMKNNGTKSALKEEVKKMVDFLLIWPREKAVGDGT